jgi:hypothetical protein
MHSSAGNSVIDDPYNDGRLFALRFLLSFWHKPFPFGLFFFALSILGAKLRK